MCCVEFVVKYILFFVNFAFWLGGVALITIGILVLTNVSEILDQLPVNLSGVPIAVIVAGSVIFVIAFSGCYGAITESRCWLIFYAVFMLIIAASKSYLAWVILSQINTIPQNAQKWINDAFNNSNIVNNNFQIFETTFRCCGSTGANAYLNLGLPIPPTCCSEPQNNTCSVDESYGGCGTKLGEYLDSYAEAVGAVIIIIIIAEVFAMLAAFYMSHAITRRRQRF
ncbi:tetraspanin family domain-containing protein [Phthorimaea operculella]|nr:tetraspanin family domain-containing protein [Phthorimaea operculella]